MSLPLLHAGRTNPGLSAALDLRFALDKSLTAYRGPTPSFSRASTGSYFDGSGVLRYAALNTTLYSEDFSNAYWTKSNATISTNQTIAPDGKNTADLLYPSSTGAARGIYYASPPAKTISLYAKSSGKNWIALTDFSAATSAWFNLSNGTVGTVGAGYTAAIQNAGNGWYRCSLTKTTDFSYFQIYGTDSDNTLTATVNGTDGVFIWGAQAEASSTVGTYCPTTNAANSAPRFNHTYNGTSWISRGLLVEEQRTNSLTNSEDLTNAYWTKYQLTISGNAATAPDGTTTADKLLETAVSDYHVLYQNVTISSPKSFSIFLKAAERSAATISFDASGSTTYLAITFNLSSGTVSQEINNSTATYSATIASVGNGWYRCAVNILTIGNLDETRGGRLATNTTATPTIGGYGLETYLGDITKGILAWGFQFEAGAFPTSYIPTTSASATRSADVCQITGTDFSGIWNGAEGTLVAEYDYQGTISSGPLRLAEAPSGNQSISIQTSSGNLYCEVYSSTNGGTQASFTSSPPSIGIATKTAIGFAANNFAASFNGSTVQTDNSGAMPTGVANAYIGSPGGAYLNGHIARLRYFNKRLPNATLQLLSEPDPTLNLQFALNKSLTPVAGPAPSFSRASTGTYFNASGVLTSASINTPRFDHVYSGGQWVSKGLLVEEQRTNLILYSNDLTNAAWNTIGNLTPTSNAAISPEGLTNANQIMETHFALQAYAKTSATYTLSAFVKPNGRDRIYLDLNVGSTDYIGYFDLTAKTYLGNGGYSNVDSYSITDVGNGWVRVSITKTTNLSNYGIFLSNGIGISYSGDATKGVYIYGVQLETGSFATSYIPTTSSSVTRSADVCQITGTSFNWMWNQGEGSVVAEWDARRNSGGQFTVYWARDAASSNTVLHTGREALSPPGVRFSVVSSASVSAEIINAGFPDPGVQTKTAGCYKANDFAYAYNGALVGTDASGAVPINPTDITIGYDPYSNYLNGHIAKLIYYPARLTNTKLQQLST